MRYKFQTSFTYSDIASKREYKETSVRRKYVIAIKCRLCFFFLLVTCLPSTFSDSLYNY